MSKIEVDAIDKQSGSTLTLGGSGTAVTLACGATQTGFGRTGTVNWQTTVKTATFTAASGEGYFCNTSGGAFTVNLPSSPSVGDIVAVKDYASTFDTQNLTIGRGGSNMNGNAGDSIRNTENESLTLVYADATKGWLAVEEGTGFVGESFITATGGTITTSGDFKIHTFTGPGTFCVSDGGNTLGSNTVDYMVVAGGGGGGGRHAGGGGAGGFRESSGTASGCYTTSPLGVCVSAFPVLAKSYPVTVGAGGEAGRSKPIPVKSGGQGSPSIFSTISSAGGGGGVSASQYANEALTLDGGSGGGGALNGMTNFPRSPDETGGSGNTPPVSPSQGNNGGIGQSGAPYNGGGGGGATVAGADGSPVSGGNGGNGATTSISASSTVYAGGGGGGGYLDCGGSGGTGGGGDGGDNGTQGIPATINTGGGGGGTGNMSPADPAAAQCGARGGSGIVIIRYKFQ